MTSKAVEVFTIVVHLKMKRIQEIVKWLTLLFFVIVIYAMTIGQIIPIEFSNWHHTHLFYNIILLGLPIVILLTLVWALKKKRSKKINFIIGILTSIISVGIFFVSIFSMFSFGFGAWINEEIIYEKKDDPEITINQQLWDIGALGYGGRRTVKLTPLLGIWNTVEKVDTSKIDIDNWILVQKEGDLKFP